MRRAPVSARDFAHVGNVPGQRGSGDGRGRPDVDLRVRVAEPAPEVAVGAGDHDVAVAGDEVPGDVHAGAAARRLHGGARLGQRLDQALARRLQVDVAGRRRDDHAHALRDALALEYRGGLAQVVEPAVGAGADQRVVDALALELRRADDVVDTMLARHLRGQLRGVDLDALAVGGVSVGRNWFRLARAARLEPGDGLVVGFEQGGFRAQLGRVVGERHAI